jgi:YD repeat-containing protein
MTTGEAGCAVQSRHAERRQNGYDLLDHLTGVVNAHAQVVLGYDALGRVTSETSTLDGGNGVTKAFQYDGSGRRVSRTSGNGVSTGWGYKYLCTRYHMIG